MRPAHPPDSRNVDRRVTRANSRHSSYTNERLEALGVSSPPRSGWRPLAAVLVVIALVLIGFYWTDLVSFVIAIMNPQESPCTPVVEDFTDILGPPYPAQSLNGSRYRTGPTTGGVPHKRALSPPCFVRNTNGEAVPTLVEVHGVYVYWDDEHWELHPATAWKLSSDPVWA